MFQNARATALIRQSTWLLTEANLPDRGQPIHRCGPKVVEAVHREEGLFARDGFLVLTVLNDDGDVAPSSSSSTPKQNMHCENIEQYSNLQGERLLYHASTPLWQSRQDSLPIFYQNVLLQRNQSQRSLSNSEATGPAVVAEICGSPLTWSKTFLCPDISSDIH